MEAGWFQTLFNHNLGKMFQIHVKFLSCFVFSRHFKTQPQHFWVDDSESENGCMCICIQYIYVIYVDNSPITRKLHPTKCRDEEYLINSMTMVTNMVFIGDTHVLVEKLFFGETHIEFMGFIGWETFTQCWYPSRVQLHSNKCPLVTQRAWQVQTDRVNGTHETRNPTLNELPMKWMSEATGTFKTTPKNRETFFQNDIFSILPWEHVEGLERNIADDHLLSVRPPTLRSVAPSNVDHRWGGSLKFRLWQEKPIFLGTKHVFSAEGDTRFRNFGWNTRSFGQNDQTWGKYSLGQVFVGLSTKRNLVGGQENSNTKNGNSWEKTMNFGKRFWQLVSSRWVSSNLLITLRG